MSAESSYESGQIDIVVEYKFQTDVESSWWIKNGRFTEFQLVFTSTYQIPSATTFATGIPKPVMDGTFSCLGTIAKCTINNDEYHPNSDGGAIVASVNIPANARTVLHGVYIAES